MKPRVALLLLLAAALVVGFLWSLRPDPPSPALDAVDGREAEGDALRSADALPEEGPSLEAPAARGDEARRGPLVVRVIGITGKPLSKMYVTLRGTERGASMIGRAQPTDAMGELRFDDVPYDGSVEVEFFRRNPYVSERSQVWSVLHPLKGRSAKRTVTGPELVYYARSGLPLHVEIVDADTGVQLDGVRARAGGARGVQEDGWQSTAEPWLVVSKVGDKRGFNVEVDVPKHRVAFDPAQHWTAISPFARSLRLVHPLRREVHVAVHPEDQEGAAVAAKITGIRAAGRYLARDGWSKDAYGRLRVHGVPFMPGELVHVSVCRENGNGATTLLGRIPSDAAARLELPVVLTDEEPFVGPDNNSTIGIGGSASSSFRHRRPPPQNRLEVTVLRRTGKPAAGVVVSTEWRTATTDERGRVVIDGVNETTATVRARAPGLLPLVGTVEMPRKGTVKITLREQPGAEVLLEVVDGAGTPLPYARVEVSVSSRVPWVDLEGEVQRIDPYTDHLGRRSLRNLETGHVTLRVSWGARNAKIELANLTSGESRAVRAVLPMRGVDRSGN